MQYKSFLINTKDRDNTWKENVLRNSAIVKLPVSMFQKENILSQYK